MLSLQPLRKGGPKRNPHPAFLERGASGLLFLVYPNTDGYCSLRSQSHLIGGLRPPNHLQRGFAP